MYRKLLPTAILCSGAAYLIAMAAESLLLRWILKPGTMLLIIALALTAVPFSRVYRRLMLAGLGFSVVGDTLLLLPGNQWFALGVGSFLIAHVFYILALLTRCRPTLARLLTLLPIAAYGVGLLTGLHDGMFASPGNGSLWIPIVVYVAVISVMVWTAVLSGSRSAVIGSILFFLSDSLLAWNKFVTPMAWAGYGVMVTYYLAQYLMARSVEPPRPIPSSARVAGSR
ncbi:lysoplasmalogenase [Paenibacillus elgii]|uniref:lysoplasmalogenase n=1 Tax=Paenibacillus elgii TaxID=189691 RepID=UPI0013D6A443|nr:lysoplasmalogenase [Paenibacillus elgii]